MSYDSSRGVTVLFGGETELGASNVAVVQNDTWEWDGTSWTQRTMNGAPYSPPARSDGILFYDSSAGVTVLLGGSGGGDLSGPLPLLDDRWAWDGSIWINITPDSAPAGPASSTWTGAAAYDSQRDVLVLFGGYLSDYPGEETWEWSAPMPADAGPPPLGGH